MPAALPPAHEPSPNAGAVTSVLAQLSATDADVGALTGGVAAAEVLAEFARTSAQELAKYFEVLPNHAFPGIVPRATGWRRLFVRSRKVRHRVLAVRYLQAEPTLSLGTTMQSFDVVGYLLALGEDGALRTAMVSEEISIGVSDTLPDTALPFTDERIRNVPSSRSTMRPWQGGNDPEQVAPPEAVLELLRLSATMLHQQMQAQGMMLRRLMGSGEAREGS